MSNVENDIRSRVDSFVNELSALVRRAALEAVADALKVGGGQPAARKPGRPAKAATTEGETTRKTPGRKPGRPAAAPKAAKRKAGEKRSPAMLAQITEQVYNYIKANPQQGVEQIAKALNTSTKELTLPIRKLLGEKKVGSKGQKRATRYFPR